MKQYFFDTEARVRFWADAENESEAIDRLIEALQEVSTTGIRIDCESLVPVEEKEKEDART
jgi:hypothetical protein